MTCNILALPALLIRIQLSDWGDVFADRAARSWMKPGRNMLGWEMGDWGHSKRSRMLLLALSLRHGNGLLLPSVKYKLQRLKHELRWVLVRLFWLFTHFKTCMPYFSLGPSGCSCLIRLEGLQLEITCVAWCSISLYDFGNKEDYHGFICKEIRTAVSILVSIILAFLALIEFCCHLVLST